MSDAGVVYEGDAVSAYEHFEKKSVIMHYVAYPSVFAALDNLGGVKDKEILDFGCGDGTFANLLLKRGAKFVFGTDIAPELIANARKIEEAGEKTEFRVADCGDPAYNLGRQFQLATCVYVFHYAKTREELQRFANNLSKHITPNGTAVFILVNGRDNWMYDLSLEGIRKYGYNTRKPSATAEDGAECKFDLMDKEGNLMASLTYYHYSTKTYEEVMHAAGFTHLHWSGMTISSEGMEFGSDFWKEYLEKKPAVVLVASKGDSQQH